MRHDPLIFMSPPARALRTDASTFAVRKCATSRSANQPAGRTTLAFGSPGLVRCPMPPHRYRLIDTAGSEIGIVVVDRSPVAEGEVVTLPDGTQAPVVEVYDDEAGQDGGVTATLVVEEG